MATIKISDVVGTKYLQCFDTLDNVPYVDEEEISAPVDTEAEE